MEKLFFDSIKNRNIKECELIHMKNRICIDGECIDKERIDYYKAFILACKSGDIDICKLVYNMFPVPYSTYRTLNSEDCIKAIKKAFYETAKTENSEICKWLYKKLNLASNSAKKKRVIDYASMDLVLDYAIEKDRLDFCKWLYDILNVLNSEEGSFAFCEEMFLKAIKERKKEIALWVFNETDQLKDIEDSFLCSCLRHSLEDFIFVCDLLQLTKKKIAIQRYNLLRTLVSGHDIEKCQYVDKICHYSKKDKNFLFKIDAISLTKNSQILKWIIDKFELTAEDICYVKNTLMLQAALSDKAYILQCLHDTFDLNENDVRFENNRILRNAARNGSANVCKCLHDTFNLKIEDVFMRGIPGILHDNLSPFECACHFGMIEVLKIFYNVYGVRKENLKEIMPRVLHYSEYVNSTICCLRETYGLDC